jgi:hypothetical protein
MKMYIAVLDEVPDFMTPTLVAHSVLGAHLEFCSKPYADDNHDLYNAYMDWLQNSFKKCVIRVNRKEFAKIAALEGVYLGHENTTLNAEKSCAIPVPCANDQLPNVLKYAKLWAPRVD